MKKMISIPIIFILLLSNLFILRNCIYKIEFKEEIIKYSTKYKVDPYLCASIANLEKDITHDSIKPNIKYLGKVYDKSNIDLSIEKWINNNNLSANNSFQCKAYMKNAKKLMIVYRILYPDLVFKTKLRNFKNLLWFLSIKAYKKLNFR
ncbi:hypothetical protein RBU49_13680 [Clostridium sp. MB40-C1]|uniref:hypothetical protein n=1 Tax=Clostridium sp. MB40-C1 TaxID=3070996 RepID=UPI0027DEB8CD|nr:hypothetical protein [Clostridium sp. MB40-C1]WMJ79907.1 hypothetical protein RBU49_13680 [Clostridium sp. MB40-C1]